MNDSVNGAANDAGFARIAAALQRAADVLGAARAREIAANRARPGKAWGDPRLLWPLFPKG